LAGDGANDKTQFESDLNGLIDLCSLRATQRRIKALFYEIRPNLPVQ